jgi:hypothetical protein
MESGGGGGGWRDRLGWFLWPRSIDRAVADNASTHEHAHAASSDTTNTRAEIHGPAGSLKRKRDNQEGSSGTEAPDEACASISTLSAEVTRLSGVVFEQNGRLAALEAILHPDAHDGRVYDLEMHERSQNARIGALFWRLGAVEDRVLGPPLDATEIIGHTTEGFPMRLAQQQSDAP